MKIEPGRIINDFIEPNKRQYAIPVYQRNYEWSREQCVKLFKDIVQAYKSDRTHFCGSVVYAQTKEEHNIHYYVVIDGQQRLTTIYLLIKAMLDMAETDAERAAMEEALINKDKFDTYDVDTASKLKLKPIKSDNNQLWLLMENRHPEVDRNSGIWHNYELFCQLIKEQQEDGLSVKDIYRGLEKLICAKIRLDADDNAQEIFERINSTGVPLSLADKIRNFVLMVDADQESLYENYWLPAENAVRRENMAAFFLDFLNLKVDGFPREDIAYEVFKDVYLKGKYTNQSMLEEILHYARYYKAFLFGDERYSEKTNQLLADLQKLKQTTVFLFLFRLFDDYEAGVINQEELEKVLTFLRNYSIRRIMCEISSNSLRGLYKTLYARLFARPENKAHYYDAVVSFFMQLTSRDVLPTQETFVAALEEYNLYRKNALCKYLLTAIENQGKEQLITDNLTVEHIMPQNKNLSASWQAMLGERWAEDHSKYLHTLGNLTLTGYNSELGDKPFAEKKAMLADVHSKITTLYDDVRDKEIWDVSAIQTRAKRLSGIIVSLFPIDPPEEEISFMDPRYQEYTCDDPDTATYKTPAYFVLRGERVNCTSFAEMLKLVIERLYEFDASIIKDMARNNEHLVDWSQHVMFSYDEKVVKSGYRITGTDIYEDVGFSSSHIMNFIRALLDRYDVDRSDFIYCARSNKNSADKPEVTTSVSALQDNGGVVE